MRFTIYCADSLREKPVKYHEILKEFNVEYNDNENSAYITINSLEELMRLIQGLSYQIILDKDNEIIIYDDYNE